LLQLSLALALQLLFLFSLELSIDLCALGRFVAVSASGQSGILLQLGGLEIVFSLGSLLLSSQAVGDGSLILGVKVVVRVLLALVVGVLNVALRLRSVSLIASLVDTTVTNVGVARHDGCVEVVFLVVEKEEFCEEMRFMLYEKKFN